MDAKTAALRATEAAERIRQEKIRAKDEARKLKEDADRKYLDKEFPGQVKHVLSAIERESNKGKREIFFNYNSGVMADALEKYLKGLGYRTFCEFWRETSNMGDSSAPCMVESSGWSLKVIW